MNYLKLFEDFNQFPNVFGDKLTRGAKVDMSEYIDNPSKRKVKIGSQENDDYRLFLENYAKLGLQDPTRAVHFYLRPDRDSLSMMNFYGNTFKVIPHESAKFSFSREIRNGGLGSTWYFISRTLADIGILINVDYNPKINPDKINQLLEVFHLEDKSQIPQVIKSLINLEDMYNEDKQKFIDLITGYQKLLIQSDVVGNLSYKELLELSNQPGKPIQIWTESEVLHQKI